MSPRALSPLDLQNRYKECRVKPRSINTIGRVTQHAESQKHGVYLQLLTKLSQSCHVVYHVQPIVMVYTS